MDKLGNPVYLTLPPEDDEGCIEYKWNLSGIDRYKRNKLISQMRWRVCQSTNYSALYIIGVHDNGQVTGLSFSDFTTTYVNLLDCANVAKLYTCLLFLRRFGGRKSYWGVVQVFSCIAPKKKLCSDIDLPSIPTHEIPNYLLRIY